MCDPHRIIITAACDGNTAETILELSDVHFEFLRELDGGAMETGDAEALFARYREPLGLSHMRNLGLVETYKTGALKLCRRTALGSLVRAAGL